MFLLVHEHLFATITQEFEISLQKLGVQRRLLFQTSSLLRHPSPEVDLWLQPTRIKHFLLLHRQQVVKTQFSAYVSALRLLKSVSSKRNLPRLKTKCNVVNWQIKKFTKVTSLTRQQTYLKSDPQKLLLTKACTHSQLHELQKSSQYQKAQPTKSTLELFYSQQTNLDASEGK